jgi:hypothetical protein
MYHAFSYSYVYCKSDLLPVFTTWLMPCTEEDVALVGSIISKIDSHQALTDKESTLVTSPLIASVCASPVPNHIIRIHVTTCTSFPLSGQQVTACAPLVLQLSYAQDQGVAHGRVSNVKECTLSTNADRQTRHVCGPLVHLDTCPTYGMGSLFVTFFMPEHRGGSRYVKLRNAPLPT